MALIAALIALVFAAGCAKKTKRIRLPAAPRIGSIETGIASWYGIPYHGRRAANGEIYDMEKLTAAHRTLSFGTWVEVENLDNGKMVTVRITDRGPFIDGRIIDLSKAAAREVGLLGPGLARVRLKIVTAPPITASTVPFYSVQIGSFTDRTRAEGLRRGYEAEYGVARVVMRPGNPTVWRVLVGAVTTIDEANELRSRLETKTGQEAFVVMLDDSSPVTPGVSR